MYLLKVFILFSAFLGLSLFASCAKKGGRNANPEEEGRTKVGWVTDFPQGLKMAQGRKRAMMLEESTYTNPKVAKFLDDLICVRVNAEKDTLISRRYRIHGYPTVLFLQSNGEEIDRIVGYLPPQGIYQRDKGYIEREGCV